MKKQIIFKLSIILFLVTVLVFCLYFFAFNKNTEPEQNIVQPANNTVKQEKIVPKIKKHQEKTPILRDENDMPKSDINVPEIG